MKIDENGNTVTELGTLTADSEEDHLNCRSGYYGSVLSGAYGGVLAGFEGGWGPILKRAISIISGIP